MEVKFTRVKSQALFNDLTNKSNSTIYFIEDIKKIYLNGVYYGISPEDEDKFLKLTGGTIDGNIKISGTINFLDDPNVGGTAGSINASWTDTPDGKGLYINGVLFKNEFIDFKEKQLRYIADGTSDEDAVNLGQLNTAIQNNVSNKLGTANGIATLDNTGKVPSNQLPSYVDDVLEYPYSTQFPTTGEAGKIYVALDSNKTYRWSGSGYREISSSLALGETASTAYRGDRGKTAYDHSQKTSGNPHNVSKSDVGLGFVLNYGIASQSEAEAGTTNAKYMTPLQVFKAIKAYLLNEDVKVNYKIRLSEMGWDIDLVAGEGADGASLLSIEGASTIDINSARIVNVPEANVDSQIPTWGQVKNEVKNNSPKVEWEIIE